MPSPFPGMDPYLEEPDTWSDFHSTFYVAIRAELNARLPAGYFARIDCYVWIHEPTHRREGSRYLKIIDSRDRRVVTVVEILSPVNKSKTADRELYLAKRQEYLAKGINLVEIDLLRSGDRMPLSSLPLPPSDYLFMVSRTSEYPQAAVWPFSIRDPLPIIPIPLTPQEPDEPLPLEPCFDRAFAEGRYETEINYAEPPTPPLAEPDATWARDLLAGWLNRRR